MTKSEVIEKLNNINLDKEKILILSGASLVLHDVLDLANDIDIACKKEYYEKIDWPIKKGFFDIDIKYYDVFEISNNLYEDYKESYNLINGYKVMNLEACLDLKRRTNKEKDKELIRKLEMIINK